MRFWVAFTYLYRDAPGMSGRPVLQSSFEYHAWKMLEAHAFPKGGPSALLGEIEAFKGTVSSQVLVMMVDELAAAGLADRASLRKVVSKSRVTDCGASVRACEVLLAKGDIDGAEEILAMSEGSQEKVRRSLARARIALARGDTAGAFEAASCAYGYDPSCRGAYDIFIQTDPTGGWPQRENIQDVLEGRKPSRPPSSGRMQDLYAIYYDWFSGRRDAATRKLIESGFYKDKDPEFLLASARMSMDERDWRSALMVYSELISMEPPPFVYVETAEAAMGVGDIARALRYLEMADGHQTRVRRDAIRAYTLMGDRRGMSDAIRIFLDSESSGSDEYVAAVGFLIEKGMEREASMILDRYSRFVGDDSDTLTMRSVMQMRSGDYISSRISACKAVRADKNNNAARAQLARLLYLTDNAEAAKRECEGILARDGSNVDALALMRDLSMSEGDYESAIADCRRILEVDPSDIPSKMALAEAMCRKGDEQKASDVFRDVLRTDGSRDRAVSVVSAMVSCGMYRDAESLSTVLERTYPKDAMLKRLKGNAQYALGEYLKASVSFSEAAVLEPHDPVLWHSKGMADEARGDLESAEDAYNRALLLDQGEAEYWISKAAVQERCKDRFGAVESLNRAMELDPRSIYPLVRKAVILASSSKFREALYYARKAAAISPSDVGVMDLQVDLLVSSDDMQAAEDMLRARIAREETPEASLRLARMLVSKGDRDGALAVLDEAIALHPDNGALSGERIRVSAGELGPKPEPEPVQEVPVPEEPAKPPAEDPEALYAMASNLLDAGDIKGAMRAVDRAITADPSNPDYHCLKARIILAKGDYEGASFIAEGALRTRPDDPALRRVNALAKEAKGDMKSALAEIDRAIAHGLDDAESNRIKARVLEKLGQHERAASCYARVVSLDPEDLDSAEAQARQQIAVGNMSGAFGTVSWILRRDPSRESAILMKAEISAERGDDPGIMSAYSLLSALPKISDESKVRMVRILEDSGHKDEARSLMGGSQKSRKYDNAVKRAAEKVLRRAYMTKTSASDPDIMDALGLEPALAEQVTRYLADIPDCGTISPAMPDFGFLERQSHDVVLKMKWSDLEGSPDLPLEKVFILGGFREADAAKDVVAYVKRAVLSPPGQADDRLSAMAMNLLKGMSIYEIMSQCDLGVYEAVIVKNLIV